MNPLYLALGLLSLAFTLGCQSRPIIPDVADVQLSRNPPQPECKEIGRIVGTTLSAKGTRDEAIADLKKTAANKGANYVVVKQYSDTETYVTGMAYECP